MTKKWRTTLSKYLIEQQRLTQNLPADLRLLIEVVARACKSISYHVSKGALGEALGSANTENIQGEIQKKLDILSNEILLDANEWGGNLAAMASEEMETFFPIPSDYPQGQYLLVFDPLDGSSNIDVNVSIGTIFSILRCPDAHPSEQSFLQPGTEQVAAGYAIYGPQSMLVLTTGNGVNIFTLDRELGSWVMTQKNVRIPENTQEYAINMSNQRFWHPPIAQYIEDIQLGELGPRKKNFNMRWIASMVADVHRILNRGGIFLYPSDQREQVKHGKLRLMYEANPIAFIIEQAGGAASTGTQRILEISPQSLHQRTSVILGAKEEVEVAIQYHQKMST